MKIYKVEIPCYYNWEVHWFDNKPDNKYLCNPWPKGSLGNANDSINICIPKGTLLEVESLSSGYVEVVTKDKQLRFSITLENLKFIGRQVNG